MSNFPSLADLYPDDDDLPPETAETPAQPEPAAEAEQPADVAATTGDQDEVPPTSDEPEPDQGEGKGGLLAAKIAETRKRQEAEQRALQAEAKLQAYEQMMGRQVAPQPEAEEQQQPEWLDPEAVQYVEKLVESKTTASRLETAEMLTRTMVADYDEFAPLAIEAAERNPAVRQAIVTASNPAMAAYEYGKRLARGREYLADPDGYEARIRAEERAKLEAERTPSSAKAAIAAPPSLAGVTSTGSRQVSAERYSRPVPLDELYDG